MNKSTNPNVKNSAIKKTAIFFAVTVLVMVSTFSFAVLYHEDSVQRVEFSLLNQKGIPTTEKDLAGRHMMVAFGFTNCPDICTPQLQKLTRIMEKLKESGKEKLINPVFITVDPERDTPEQLDKYLEYFHESVVGLTGSRSSIKRVTDLFSTLLPDSPKEGATGYYVAHSAQIYIVDPYGRIIDHISFSVEFDDIVKKVKSLI